MFKEVSISFFISLITIWIFSSSCSTFTSQQHVECFHGTKPTGNLDPKFQCIDYSYSDHWNEKNELIKVRIPRYSEGTIINYNLYSLNRSFVHDPSVDVMFFYFFLAFCYAEITILWSMSRESDYGLLNILPFWGLTGYVMVFLNNYYKMLFPLCVDK